MAQEETMRIEVKGYIARDGDDIIFSNLPMKKELYADGDVWYDEIEKEDDDPLLLSSSYSRQYLDIPGLTEKNSPRHCKLTIEVGEQLPGNDQREIDRRVKAMRIRDHVRTLAEVAGRSFEDTAAILRKSMPDIDEYLKEEEM